MPILPDPEVNVSKPMHLIPDRKVVALDKHMVARNTGHYKDGSPAIELLEIVPDDVDTDDPEGYDNRWCVLTVFVSGAADLLRPGEFLVKDWSENEATVADLVKQGVLVLTGKGIYNGYVIAKVAHWAPV